jgi:hypothetical protein
VCRSYLSGRGRSETVRASRDTVSGAWRPLRVRERAWWLGAPLSVYVPTGGLTTSVCRGEPNGGRPERPSAVKSDGWPNRVVTRTRSGGTGVDTRRLSRRWKYIVAHFRNESAPSHTGSHEDVTAPQFPPPGRYRRVRPLARRGSPAHGRSIQFVSDAGTRTHRDGGRSRSSHTVRGGTDRQKRDRAGESPSVRSRREPPARPLGLRLSVGGSRASGRALRAQVALAPVAPNRTPGVKLPPWGPRAPAVLSASAPYV